MERQFDRYQGPPPGARLVVDADGEEWWWHYADGIWTVFTVSDRTTRWFGPTTRTITVFAFRARPPAPGAPRPTPGS